MLLASALVMAASGEASAQTTLAVIAQYSIPYSASPQDVFSKPPVGQFEVNMHLCEEKEMTILDNMQYLRFILPSGESVYSEFRFQRAITRDPTGDKSCMSQVASTTLPASIPPPVQRVPQPAPNYVTPPTMAASGEASAQTTLAVITKAVASSTETSGTIDSANDPSMRADIADVVEFNRSSLVPKGEGIPNLDKLIENDPDAGNPDTEQAIADVFFLRGRNWRQGSKDALSPRYMKEAHMETNKDWIYDDRRFNDLQRARFWYQRALAQIYTKYPDCTHGMGANCPSDPSGRIASLIYNMENGLVFCPTVLQRQQERATAEKEKINAKEGADKRDKEIALLLAKRKEIGDTVCDPSSCTGSSCVVYGQVENVHNDKIEVRVHVHESGSIGIYPFAGTPGRDYDKLEWVNYNAVVECTK
jgi:hypothetical protein